MGERAADHLALEVSVATDPVPPVVPRSDVLGTLRRERWFAADAGETARVAELDARIARLSAANTATAPTRETTARPPAAPRGDRRVRTRR